MVSSTSLHVGVGVRFKTAICMYVCMYVRSSVTELCSPSQCGGVDALTSQTHVGSRQILLSRLIVLRLNLFHICHLFVYIQPSCFLYNLSCVPFSSGQENKHSEISQYCTVLMIVPPATQRMAIQTQNQRPAYFRCFVAAFKLSPIISDHL